MKIVGEKIDKNEVVNYVDVYSIMSIAQLADATWQDEFVRVWAAIDYKLRVEFHLKKENNND